MAWFGRERKSAPTDDPWEQWLRRVTDAGLRFVEIKQNGQATYQTLACYDPETAKRFLMNERVDSNGCVATNSSPWRTSPHWRTC